MRPAIPLAMLLCACGEEKRPVTGERVGAPAAAIAAEPAARAFVSEEKNGLIEFRYAWSAEAAAVPMLVARFQKKMEETRAALVAGAEEDRSVREEQGFPFHGHMSSTDHETAGQSDRLLSLRIEQGSYTGGAHGNFGVGALLLDRNRAREMEVAELFTAPQNMDRLLTQRWCDALNAAREEKRGEPVGGSGVFDDCPSLSDIAIIPVDRDGNRRFERLVLVASPYVAGPWAEGSYEIDLAVTPDLLAALRADYRDSFEVAPTQ